MKSTHTARALVTLVAILATFVLVGCETSDGDTPVATPGKDDNHTNQTPKSSDPAPGDNKVERMDQNAISTELYPNIPLGLLKPEQRSVLVRVNKATLCPCPNAAESLHECLQKEDKQCQMAVGATQEGMRKILDGLSENDVLDGVGQFIEVSFKKYDFDLENSPRQGPKDAKVVIVEFADFECPYCSKARVLLKAARAKYPDKVAVYFKQFPLSMHPNATEAALASMAAWNQNRFWEMYDLLFDNQKTLSKPKIAGFAQGLGLNMDKFAKDKTSPDIADKVKNHVKEGDDAAVNSTPTFFINGRRYVGDFSPEAFVEAVESEL